MRTVCESGAMDTWELAARESIRDLVARYAHAADRGRFDDLAALFAADGALELPDGRIATGGAEIVALLRGTGHDLRDATTAPLVRHHVSSHAIVVHGEDRADGFAYFFVVTARGPDHWGRYQDAYVAIDGAWRFGRRRVRLDGFAPGSWAASRRG